MTAPILYYVDDVGRLLAPVLMLCLLLRWATSTRWWLFWDTRALFVLLTTSVVTKIILATATVITPPRVVEISVSAQILNIMFWWTWVFVAAFFLIAYEVEERRARRAARINDKIGDADNAVEH